MINIITEEHPYLFSMDLPSTHVGNDPNDTKKYVDCRLYKKFVKSICSDLKQEKTFKMKEVDGRIQVQTNACTGFTRIVESQA